MNGNEAKSPMKTPVPFVNCRRGRPFIYIRHFHSLRLGGELDYCYIGLIEPEKLLKCLLFFGDSLMDAIVKV